MFTYICKAIRKRCLKREPDFIVGDDQLLRWFIMPRNRFLNVYLHEVRKSDEGRALHDHPWHSASYMFEGRMFELTPDPRPFYRTHLANRIIEAGQWRFRSAKFAHRLAMAGATRSAWTLFITGPRVREWGFYCPQGWVHWKLFTSQGGCEAMLELSIAYQKAKGSR